MIQQLIGNIVAQLIVEDSSPSVAPTYIHGSKGWTNLAVDEITNTVVLLIEPVQSNNILEGALMIETYPVLMVFLEKSELDWTPDQQLVVIDRMRRLCNKFIYKATQSAELRYVRDIIISDEYNLKDAGLSGVGLQIKLTPLLTVPIC